MSSEEFLVPRREIRWGQIRDAVTGLGATEEDPPEGFLLAWRLDDAELRFFRDPGLGVAQLMVKGDDREQVTGRLREVIPMYTADDLVGMSADIPEASTGALKRMLNLLSAVAPRTADPRLLPLFRRGLHHKSSLVRHTAAIAATVPAWPELRPDIERLLDDDDEDVRETARVALRDFDRAAQQR